MCKYTNQHRNSSFPNVYKNCVNKTVVLSFALPIVARYIATGNLATISIPMLINDTDEMNVKPKDDDDQMMGRPDPNEDPKGKAQRMMGRVNRPIRATIDWNPFVKSLESVPREALAETISKTLLQNMYS